ncbi:MAG: 23S rRNA (uracil(1939)-C(5))-methyltransferase RlmD [Firmicutes bacterium]|nr:23S rRNA (uracil(1939)-C(5))-methyltransferase RlmD [Bacillota bacterium]
MRKGETVELELTGLTHSGEGVGRREGFAVFVPGALPGERVKARVTGVKKNYATALLDTILQPSPERQEPVCPVFRECGGCQLQHLKYEAQLAYKRQLVVDALNRIGKLDLDHVVVRPTLGVADPFHYRNKAQYPVGFRGGRVVTGFYTARSHDIVPIADCHIQHPLNGRIAGVLRGLLEKYRLSVYDERTGQGLIRHLLIRTAAATGEAMAVLVTNGRDVPHLEEIAAELTREVPQVAGVVQNVNTQRTNVILGDYTRTIAGRDEIIDEIRLKVDEQADEGRKDRADALKFAISARSFFQVNPVQTGVLYGKAIQYAALEGNETVVDAYCGIGAISLFLAQRAGFVYGIEEVAPAIEDARKNAALNGITNVEFLTGKVEDLLPSLYSKGIRPEVIVVDPPRKGCEESVLQTFVAMAPRRIVYVSCNPSTLARDLALLAGMGYETREVQPVDMFPQTSHVESIVLMTNSGQKDK